MSDAPIVVSAPPSVEAAQQGAVANLANLLVNLRPGLMQGQADLATLQGLLANWPVDAPASLQPVVQVVARLVEDVSMMGEGIQDILTALQAI